MSDTPADGPDGPDSNPPADPPGGLEGLGGAGSPFDLLASAQEALSAQADAVNQVVEGTSGGGVVQVTMTGGGEVTGIKLSAQVVDPDDIEMLQDLIVAALRDATAKVTELQRAALGALGQLDLGSLGGLLGGGTSEQPG
jgi:DNA-binding YbaB/EbfC family protein